MSMFTMDQLKGNNGKPRVQSLFLEMSYEDTSTAIFTLKDDVRSHHP